MDLKSEIRKFALANAYEHGGKAQAGAIVGKLMGQNLITKDQIGKTMSDINKIVSEVNKIPIKKQEAELKKVFPELFKKREEKPRELPDMPNAEKGKIVMRLAPFPSGALHIGNMKTYMLNALYCEKYDGTLLFVMDDTMGSVKKFIPPEAYDLIPEGFKWMNVHWKGPIIYKSDRMEKYYRFAEDLIKRDLAYVCECAAETLRDNRKNGVACDCRSNSAKTNIEKWKNILAKKYKEGKVVLRLKTDMQHPNPAFRDRVLVKVAERAHPRVGNKYTVWPSLELSWAYDDHDLGSTHIFRGNDLTIETDTCRFIWDKLGWKVPVLVHTGLIRLKGVKFSKSKSLQEVRKGTYSGWDDPRTWSMQSLRKRGILPEAVREFIKEIGPNHTDIEVPIDNLYTINRKLIDPVSDRYFMVFDPVKISIAGAPLIKEVKLKYHPDKKEERSVKVGDIWVSKEDLDKFKGKETRLLHLFNAKLGKKAKFTSAENKDIQKIQWVSSPHIEVKVLMPDGVVRKGYAESAVGKLKEGSTIQAERIGFMRLDSKKDMLFCFAHR